MENRHNAYLKDENLLTLFSLNNMIVPEIQREYVWGNNSDVLEKFLVEIERKATPCATCHHVHTNKSINVGFLYSYKPPYARHESERSLDEFLIDGQQRITTLFLLLLYRSTIEGRIDDFMSICRADESSYEMGFNYKVRSLTQQFLIQLILHVKEEQVHAFDFVSDMDNAPYWFLDDYKADPTVTSMLSALRSIIKVFGDASNFYFDYLITNIRFWHFKTEATSQGEELYITMNSRGEQLADNEIQKSRVLPSSDLPKYGREWEAWQTFFWRNRNLGEANNPNADRGFNNFLACIDGLECFNEPSKKGLPMDVEAIKVYMDGLRYLCSEELKNNIRELYPSYTCWFDNFINVLWNEINTYDGRWDIVDPRGGDQFLRNDYRNKSVARNKSMLFWPWMTYFKMCSNKGDKIDNALLTRLLHFYYIRYQCYKRSSTSINAIVRIFVETNGKIHTLDSIKNDEEEEDNANSNIFSDEELSLAALAYSDESKVGEVESVIWSIQDLPYFLDGKNVGGNTVYELFCGVGIINKDGKNGIVHEGDILSRLCTFKERIIGLLGLDDGKASHIEVKRALLFYRSDENVFWCRQSPWYYSNYETSSWKRIVRGWHFAEFYKEFYALRVDLGSFLESKRKEFFAMDENNMIYRNGKPWSHRKLVILYDLLSAGGIWDDHENVALWNNQGEESEEEIFVGLDTIWRARRYYDRGSKVCLLSNWQEILNEKYKVRVV